MQDPSLQCPAEDLERHGRPCQHYWLHLQNQSDVWGSIMTRFPPGPVAEKSHPRSLIPPVVCIVMMKLCISVLCCQVIQPDLHMVPDGQQQFMAGG